MKKLNKFLALGLTCAMTLSLAACSMGGNPNPGGTAGGATSGGAGSGATSSAAGSSGGASSAESGGYQYDPSNQYPGMVVYRDGDPQPNLDVEITSTDKITWVVAACLQETNPQSRALALMAQELSEKTNGNFTWDIFYNSELGSESEAVELVRNNTAQFVTSNVTVISPYVDAFGVFALPYLFHSELDELNYLSTSQVAYDLYDQLESTANLVTLGFNCTGSRCLSTKGVDRITSPADLQAKGVKVRSMEAKVWQDVISSLGATPVPVAYTELYTALQTGVVQGQDNPVANTVDGKFYEVLDTFYETEHSYLVSGYYTNTESWNALPDDYKALLMGLMEKYQGNYYHEEILKFQEEAKNIMKNVTFVGQDELDMDAFYESANKMIEDTYMSNETYAPVIQDVKATFNY